MASKKLNAWSLIVPAKRKKTHVLRTLDPGPRLLPGGRQDGLLRTLMDTFLPSWQPSGSGASSTGPSTLDGSNAAGSAEGSFAPDVPPTLGVPLLPAIVFLSCLAVLGITFFNWQPTRTPVRLGPLSRPDVQVWVNTSTGNFYCDGSILYEQGAGQLMAQGQAVQMGYQPGLSTYCDQGPAVVTRVASRRPANAPAAGADSAGAVAGTSGSSSSSSFAQSATSAAPR